jgi:sarcosine oxidase
MGSATAWQLARQQADVVLLEQFGQGHLRGSSHGATRIFRFSYAWPEYVAMAKAALPHWRELEDDADEPLLDITGGLDIGAPALIAPIAEALEANGAAFEQLGEADVAERWPGLAVNSDDAVLYSPDGGRLWADRSVAALQRRAAHYGAEVRYDERVLSVDANAGTAATDVETYEADAIVVTAGAWLADLVAGSGADATLPPLRVTREQTFHFPPLDDDVAWPSFIHHRGDEQALVYGLETPGEGIKVAEDHAGPETDPDDRSFVVDEIGRQRVIRYVTERLPGLDPTPVTELTCLYTSTPDGAFVLERHGRLVIGSPCSGHGFKFTPLIGRILADLATKPG